MCVWPAGFPSIQPGLGNLSLPLSIPVPLPACNLCMVLLSCSQAHSSALQGKQEPAAHYQKDIPNTWLSTCFFQVLGVVFPFWGRQELLRELPASHPCSVPLWLPDQGGTCSSRSSCSPAGLPVPPQPLHPSRTLGMSRVTHSSGAAGLPSPGLSAATAAPGACPTWIFLALALGGPRVP